MSGGTRHELRARCTSRWLGAIAVAAALVLAAPAAAAPDDDAGPSDAQARDKLSAGMEKFDAGDFEGAQRDFEASFEKENNPLSLWGWAQATNKVDGCHKSVKLYRQFSKMVDEGSPAYDVALQAIAECADKLAREEEPPAPPETEFEDEEDTTDADVEEDRSPRSERVRSDRPWYRDPWGGALVGVGAAATATGIGLLATAAVEQNNPCDTYDCFEQQQARVDRMTIAGGVVVGVGGALLVAGAIRWGVLGARQRGRTSAGPLLHPRTVGVSIAGRF